jgi:hypothetical protein
MVRTMHNLVHTQHENLLKEFDGEKKLHTNKTYFFFTVIIFGIDPLNNPLYLGHHKS